MLTALVMFVKLSSVMPRPSLLLLAVILRVVAKACSIFLPALQPHRTNCFNYLLLLNQSLDVDAGSFG